MSTSCKVGYKENDTITYFTRVNWDGYPDYVGRKLLKFYNTEDKAKEIASSKEIRSISECGLLEFYDNSRKSEVESLSNFINRCYNEDYGYLWFDNCWWILNKEKKDFVHLEEILQDDDNCFDGPDLYDSDAGNLET